MTRSLQRIRHVFRGYLLRSPLGEQHPWGVLLAVLHGYPVLAHPDALAAHGVSRALPEILLVFGLCARGWWRGT
jgi:hypothetical protein